MKVDGLVLACFWELHFSMEKGLDQTRLRENK